MRVTHLLRESIGVARYLSAAKDGAPVYGARVDDVPARVEYTSAVVLDGKGEERSTTAKVVTDVDFPIRPRDRVWLPGRAAPLTPVDGGCTEGKDVRGNLQHHETVL